MPLNVFAKAAAGRRLAGFVTAGDVPAAEVGEVQLDTPFVLIGTVATSWMQFEIRDLSADGELLVRGHVAAAEAPRVSMASAVNRPEVADSIAPTELSTFLTYTPAAPPSYFAVPTTLPMLPAPVSGMSLRAREGLDLVVGDRAVQRSVVFFSQKP